MTMRGEAGGYQVFIDDSGDNFMRLTARIYVGRPNGDHFESLLSDGTWWTTPRGETGVESDLPEGVRFGLSFPARALDALAGALYPTLADRERGLLTERAERAEKRYDDLVEKLAASALRTTGEQRPGAFYPPSPTRGSVAEP